MYNDLFYEIKNKVNVIRTDHKGNCHITCPQCGKTPSRTETKFSFNNEGFNCFVCGFSGGLKKLAEYLCLDIGSIVPYIAPRRPVKKHVIPGWTINPKPYLDGLKTNHNRYDEWYNHKRIKAATVDKFQLGLSILPGTRCKHQRLIVPVFELGNLVGIRGRAIKCPAECPKWLNATGSKPALFNGDLITTRQVIIITENNVDSCLTMQETDNVIAVSSTNGASTWRSHWSEAIAKGNPSQVVVFLDCDCPGGIIHPRDLSEHIRLWKEENPKSKYVPESNAVKIVNELLLLKVKAIAYQWPRYTPRKMDLGSLLLERIKKDEEAVQY